ncbi:MAG: 4-hydroxy-3-methylbut-2-enyl diphosphate reductase, partial [Ruminococcaceae bacterium]|nr:4-hydroxy-3-methylbut-2-enyl diphosphate reductase [Oscillospiraceae bacterium]
MKRIILSANAGFCPGVRRADNTIRSLIQSKKDDERIYTLGTLIHNRIYNEELEAEGILSVSFDDVERLIREASGSPVTLVVRTHGVTKEISDALATLSEKHANFKVMDMTCPSVKRIHKIAEENTSDDTCFLLFCNKLHPEAIGILSYAKGEKHAISSPEELLSISFNGKTPILCSQTTENLEVFAQIKKILKKLCTNAIFFDTICNVTENRQNEAIQIAKKSDRMIVIGGKDSSNTQKLFELCKKECDDTLLIESAKDLLADFPDRAKCVGITAGASTPSGIITEVIKVMENKEFEALLEDTLKTLHTGDTVNGTVCTISDTEIKLDLGVKVTGVLTKEQITDDPTANLHDMFKIGDEVAVFVIRVDDKAGLATVSKKRVDADNSWVVLKEAYDNAEILEGKVVSANKGGVVVSALNNSVFVPASQTGIARGGDLTTLVGTTQKIKLIEFDTVKKKALGSIKVILNEEKRAKENAIWASLEVGQHFDGTVKNLTAYGAFVDIGGVDGMVHNTELSWKKIKHPSQVVSVGQVIDVFIKELDVEKKRISLGYKTQEMDVWYQFVKAHEVGEILPAKIVSLTPFGAFAEVSEGVDGLIHISAISTQRINAPADVLKVGDVVDVKITNIDDENRKLSLSIRAITEAAEKAAAAEARAAE